MSNNLQLTIGDIRKQIEGRDDDEKFSVVYVDGPDGYIVLKFFGPLPERYDDTKELALGISVVVSKDLR